MQEQCSKPWLLAQQRNQRYKGNLACNGDYWTMPEEEGRLHNHHCLLHPHRNLPDIKGNHSDSQAERYWEEMVCGENPSLGWALCILMKNFPSALGLLKFEDFSQERHIRTRIAAAFLPEVRWKKTCMLGWQIHGATPQFKAKPRI